MRCFEIDELRRIIGREMQARRRSNAPGDVAYRRQGEDAPLYGVTGAANLYAELGFDFGSLADRAAWCDRINAFQQADGAYHCVSGPEHAAAMAILALNLLGGRPARPVRHLAPLRADRLEAWLNRMNWTGSTHKEFCCAVAPLLASGCCDANWITVMRRNVEARLDPARPRCIWAGGDDDPPWRVVSCIYHVVSGYDAAYLPYPQPQWLWDRLWALDYEHTRNEHQRTSCTDFDYTWMLYRLCHQLPERFAEFHRHAHRVLDLMIAEWHDQRERMLEATTHELYCQSIGWALYQGILPDRFHGPPLLDTLNAPWLYRLPGPQWVREEPADSCHNPG